MLLAAQPAYELDGEPLSVEVACVVEEVNLQRLGVFTECGARADVHHALCLPAPDGIGSCGRNELARVVWLDVGSREPQLCANVFAMHHTPADAIVMPQTVGSLADGSLLQELTDARRADHAFSRQLAHLDAHLATVAHIVVEALLTVVSEAVVVARQQYAHLKTLFEHVLHKLAGGHLLQLVGEGQHLHTVDAALLHQCQLLLQGSQHGVWTKRVVEGDGH